MVHNRESARMAYAALVIHLQRLSQPEIKEKESTIISERYIPIWSHLNHIEQLTLKRLIFTGTESLGKRIDEDLYRLSGQKQIVMYRVEIQLKEVN